MKLAITIQMVVEVPDDTGTARWADAIDQICALTLEPAVTYGLGEVSKCDVTVGLEPSVTKESG